MKTTMLMRPIANPRRTRIAQLKDADEPTSTAQGQPERQDPDAEAAAPVITTRPTANPRRTVLDKLPTS
jgi:hypothetical protein